VSIIKPKPFFASRADMVFMVDSREIPLHHLGQNSSFWQAGIGGDFGVAERREADGKIKRRTVRGGRMVVFQWVR